MDGFCEGIAFTPAQIGRVFDRAGALELPVKLHAEQLSDLGGADLAARHGALSADHLEYAGESGVRALAGAGTVAVLLPGAFYTLRAPRRPPVELFRKHGVPMAISTDCNPGSSPLASLLLAMNMACTLFRLTPGGSSRRRHAGSGARTGTRRRRPHRSGAARGAGDMGRAGHPAELAYRIGFNPLAERVFPQAREARR